MLYELHKLVVQPSKRYYPIGNVAEIFHRNFHQNRLFSTFGQQLYWLFFWQNLSESHVPITLVVNIKTMLKVHKMLNYIRYTIFAIFADMLNYIHKMLYHRCLTGS